MEPQVQRIQRLPVLFVLLMKWSTNLNQTGLHLVNSHRIYLLLIKQVILLCTMLHDVKKAVLLSTSLNECLLYTALQSFALYKEVHILMLQCIKTF